MAEAAIKTVRKEIASLLQADAAITAMNVHVYNSRKLPGTFEREVCVFTLGTAPSTYAVLGKDTGGKYYQFAILWVISFDDTAELEEAQDISDDLEEAIYRVLLDENYNHPTNMWRKIMFPNLSVRPTAPAGTQNAHLGQTIVRVKV